MSPLADALGRDGPLYGWRVEYLAADGSWIDATTVQKNGAFRFSNVPGPGRLTLWCGDAGLPVAVEPLAHPDSTEVVFDLRARGEPRGSLRVRPTPPNGVAAHAEVCAWQTDTRFGTGMARDAFGTFSLSHLSTGFYRVEIGADATGWLELPPVWVDGTGVVDLGTVALPRPGELRLPKWSAPVVIELYHRRPTGDVRAENMHGEREVLPLPAGEWLAFEKVGERITTRAFTIRAGEATLVEFGAR